MTWREWVDSEYNTSNYIIDEDSGGFVSKRGWDASINKYGGFSSERADDIIEPVEYYEGTAWNDW